MKSEKWKTGFEISLYFIRNRSYSICAPDLWILPPTPTGHLTTSHCTSFREDISLNTQLSELQEAKTSPWSTPVKICSTVMINLYPAKRVSFAHSSLLMFLISSSRFNFKSTFFAVCVPYSSSLSYSFMFTLGFLVSLLKEKISI